MSEARVVACANCGARYRIPETFKASKSRCKGCGASIEIESSIVTDAAAPSPARKPQAPAPRSSARSRSSAAAKGSARRSAASRLDKRGRAKADRDEEGESTSRSERSGRTSRTRSGGGRRGAGSRSSRGRGRRDEEEDYEEKSKTPLVIGIGVGVVALGLAAFFLLGGDGDKKPDNTENNRVATGDGNARKGAGVTDPASNKEATANTEGGALEGAGKKAEGTSKEATAKKPKKKVAKKPKPKRIAGQRTTPYNPMEKVEELAWPEDVEEDERKEILDLVTIAFEDDAYQGMKATRKLEGMGRKAFAAIVNQLRPIDYTNLEQHNAAFTLHKCLEKITMGINGGYNNCEGRTPIQEEAWYNASLVGAWSGFWDRREHGDPDNWNEFIALRLKKQGEEEDIDKD